MNRFLDRDGSFRTESQVISPNRPRTLQPSFGVCPTSSRSSPSGKFSHLSLHSLTSSL
ncbi:unnamed protein product [Ilex paraguariensis]|uniref:Uncharacterized protein n=1 Tax=Ilex paraguariensis TaxID=185542 RepID=A0ABC8T4L6_9AQUA